MTGNAAPFHQNFASEKKNNDLVEKDIKKWVESVVEFKASMDKQKELPLEKRFKKITKFKTKKKQKISPVPVGGGKDQSSSQNKTTKLKKGGKKPVQQPSVEKPRRKEPQTVDAFDAIKESYRNLKLPQNWTSGVSGNRIIFNRVKVTTHKAQQKLAVEKSLVITKDRNIHILINGSEVTVNNWETQKVETVDDIKRAIKDIDSLKLCDGPTGGTKSPQCSTLIDNKLKVCDACKSETGSPIKVTKKPRIVKKPRGDEVKKQKSFQN